MKRSTYTSYRTTSGINLFKTAALLFVFGAFGYVIYYAAINSDNLADDSAEPQLIQPLAGAVKERAENPGGMEIPNQDKQVFDLLEETAPTEVALKKEDLCAGESGAILCNKNIKKVQPIVEAKPMVKQMEQAVAEVKKDAPKTIEAIVKAEVKKEMPKKVEAVKQVERIVKAQKINAIEPAAGPSKKEVMKEVKKVVETNLTPKGAGFGIQLASYGSKTGADNGVKYYRKKLGSLLDGLKYSTETVSVKGKTFYRVQLFGLTAKADANSLCKKIKAKKESCLAIVR